MKAIVGVKRVIDYAVRVRVSQDKLGVELANVKMSMNPFCEIAVEEAVRLKEKKIVSEIIAVSIGPKKCEETLRTALAMGACKGIHILSDARTDQELQPLAIAKIFAQLAEREKADVVIVGKQAIDGDNCQTGPMIAGVLNWSQCTMASLLDVKTEGITATRETDLGSETISVPLPAVISADLRLNEPRYATLPNIMKAKKKPIESIEIGTLGVDTAPRNVVSRVEEPAARKAGIFVETVDDLVDKLKNEAKVI